MHKSWCNPSSTAEDIASSVNCLFSSAEGLSALLGHRVLKASKVAFPILACFSSSAKVKLPLLQTGVTYGSSDALPRIWSILLTIPATKGTDETLIYTSSKLTVFCVQHFLHVEGLLLKGFLKMWHGWHEWFSFLDVDERRQEEHDLSVFYLLSVKLSIFWLLINSHSGKKFD